MKHRVYIDTNMTKISMRVLALCIILSSAVVIKDAEFCFQQARRLPKEKCNSTSTKISKLSGAKFKGYFNHVVPLLRSRRMTFKSQCMQRALLNEMESTGQELYQKY